jgi:gliding motility-associated-like protein
LGGIEKLSGLGAGIYTIRVTDNAGCLYTLPSITLMAPEGPAAPVVSASSASVCTGASFTLSANSTQAAATFQWTGPNGFTAAGREVIIQNAAAANTGTYSAIATVNGCLSPAATVSVTVRPAVAAPVVTDVTYCVGVKAQSLTATGKNLQWYNAATGGDPLAAAPTPFTTTAGQQEYFVSQTVDDCESPRARVTVRVIPSTDAACACNLVAFASSNPVSCRDDQDGTAIAVVQSGGSGKYLYRLLNSTAAPQDLEQFFAEFQDQLRGAFSIEITDKVTGCVRTVSQEIGAKVLWAASIGSVPATCAGDDAKIQVGAIATGAGKGAAPFQEKLYKDGVLVASKTTQTGESLFENLLPGTYRVEVTDATPCTFVREITIEGVEALKVTASASVQPQACSTNDGEITMTVAGGKAPYEYWVNDERRTDITAGKIGKLLAGDYRITVKDDNNCETTVTVALKVDPIDFIVESGEATCENPEATVRVVIEKAGAYKFSLNGIDYYDTPEFKVGPGEHTMHVRRYLSTSCPVTRKFTVTGVGAVAFNVSQVNVGCTGGAEGSITVSGITGGRLNNGEADYGITLYRGDKLVATRYTGEKPLTFEDLEPALYRVVLEYGNGCRTAAREVVITSSGIPFNVKTTPATCGSPNGSAEAMISVTGKKYFYSINNTNFFDAPLFTNLKPGEYKMYIRENANDPCANVLPFIVGGPDSLKARIRRENCNDIVLSPITGGVKPYRISVDGGNTFVSGNLFTGSYVISNLPDGNYEVVVIDNQDCRTFPVKIRINNTLAAKVKTTLSMPDEPTGEIRITDIRGEGPYEVSLNGTDWAMVKDTSIPYDTTITGQPVGDYIVYLRDINGCVKVYPGTVKESTFLIPNVFTPNNDGVNDTFFIRNLPTGTIVRIVSRWGKVVFESNNYQNDWNGGEYPDGIYYYTVNIAGKGTYSGWVQIWH